MSSAAPLYAADPEKGSGVMALEMESTNTPGTPVAAGSTQTSVRDRMISGVSKSIFSEHNKATDLSGLTRQVTLKGKLDGKINLERMNSEVQRLKMDSEFDDLDKFRANSGGGHQRALGTTDTKATQKAATKFVQSTRNSSWIKTLTAVEGRPCGCPSYPWS
jgi:hypothetical protein